MKFEEHLRLTAGALKNWLIAQCQDSLAVGAMWYVGLRILGMPLAPLWAGLAALLQLVPHLGPALGMVAPTIAAAIHWRDWRHPLDLGTVATQPHPDTSKYQKGHSN